jgi:hypothetical protein
MHKAVATEQGSATPGPLSAYATTPDDLVARINDDDLDVYGSKRVCLDARSPFSEYRGAQVAEPRPWLAPRRCRLPPLRRRSQPQRGAMHRAARSRRAPIPRLASPGTRRGRRSKHHSRARRGSRRSPRGETKTVYIQARQIMALSEKSRHVDA